MNWFAYPLPQNMKTNWITAPLEQPAPASQREQHPQRIAAASVLLFRGNDVLLIKRAHGAMAGHWSAPGGHVEAGETNIAAAARELHEETGLIARSLLPLTTHLVKLDATPQSSERIYEIAVFAGTADQHSQPRAGGDAADARFICSHGITELLKTPGLDTLIEAARLCLANAEQPPP